MGGGMGYGCDGINVGMTRSPPPEDQGFFPELPAFLAAVPLPAGVDFVGGDAASFSCDS